MSKHILSHYDPAVREVHKALQLATSTGASPEVVKTLESALNLIELRENYAESATSEQSQTLKDILEETYKHDWKKVHDEGKSAWTLSPRMLSGPLEGQLLKSLVSIHKAKRILEVGMYTGYSALALAEALPADGELVSIDMTEYLKPLVTELTKPSPHHKKIKIIIGKAVNVLQDLTDRKDKFDVIFLDADQSDYPTLLKLIFKDGLLNPGGSVLVDNAFGYGKGYTSEKNATREYTEAITSDPSLHSVLIPIRDGVLIIRRLSDVEGSVD